MKKYLISLILILIFAFYAIFSSNDEVAVVTPPSATSTPQENGGSGAGSGAPSSTGNSTNTSSGAPAAGNPSTVPDSISGLQQLLIAQGYLHVTAPTGYFGTLTEKALIAYEQANPRTGSGAAAGGSTAGANATSGTVATGGTTKPAGQYRDGTYTGSVADAFYGNVQIQATITGGKLTDVKFLQYPSDRGTSREINNQAMPYLIQEAIQAQNASVQIVSGATQTSGAFQTSLGDALAQAKA